MTLAVAAPYPWGRVRRQFESLPEGVTYPYGLITAADSRFSLNSGGHDDRGRKVYVLGSKTGLLFAGDVEAAQRLVSDLRQEAMRVKRPGALDVLTEVPRLASLAFEKAVARAIEREQDPKQLRLQVLVGVREDARGASVVKFDSISQFRPLIVTGVCAIGHKVEVDAFRELLKEHESELSTRRDSRLEWHDWHLSLVSVIRAAIDRPHRTSTVGGGIQSCVFTEDGVLEQQLSSVGPGADPMEAAAWQRATVPLAQLHNYRRRLAHSQAADHEEELAFAVVDA